MTTKKKPNKQILLRLPKFRLLPSLVTLFAFLITAAFIISSLYSDWMTEDFRDFEEGRVAERDVIAESRISYIDEEATRLRRESALRQIPAVFKYSLEVNEEVQNAYQNFVDLSKASFDAGISTRDYLSQINANFPMRFYDEILDMLYNDEAHLQILDAGMATLEQVLEAGVFALPSAALERFSTEQVELLHNYGNRTERERRAFSHILTLENLSNVIDRYITPDAPSSFKVIAWDLLSPFIKANVVFSEADTEQRLAEANIQGELVVKYIDPGTRIIKRGFIISAEALIELEALKSAISGKDLRTIVGQSIILLLLYALFIFLGVVELIGRTLSNEEIYLLAILSALYLIGAVLAKNIAFNIEYFPVSIILPTALVVMLPAILIDARLALLMAFTLPLSAFLSDSFDTWAYLFALVSGIVASYLLRNAEKRMDVVRAGLIIAGANAVSTIAILLIQRAELSSYPIVLFWAAFNGIASGMLVLGLLPPLEHALDAVTTFRLIELADLNSPTLKKLFTIAPGTYTHSLTVANLAESACRDIGANPLLARVGAYYHDIGKMEQPEYFVENQTTHNKHNELPPRLSATVIRSHVKLGVEKARALELPHAVIDIIAQHHGNSVITWFYNEALKQDPQVSVEDFSYPGSPPHSRESAVVMLADVSEAACRSLEKPTAAKIEKFIQELITAKVEHGQLAESELTFRDLEIIKKAFVRSLAAHYHSRIAYPKLPPKEPVAGVVV
ncbi:MAG: HDIG domain-containing protein [Treponema sp.]|jgi:putative nucleotidyltransferase with HDIG domain|nr:HDIG domain-containing protein [Treponema sp.]